MLNLQLATKYSRAMFLLAEEEGKLNEYGAELKALNADIESSEDLKAYFESPMIPGQAKKDVAQKIFEGDLSQMAYNFLQILLDKQRIALLPTIVEQYENFANEAQGVIVADVTTARELSENQGAKLTAKLGELTGKTIKLRKHLKSELLGGMVVRMGDRLIDGSLRTQMQALGEALMAS